MRSIPVDGQPMLLIRWEESTQLDYVPASIKKIVHRRGVYACGAKHDEARLITAPKPPQPIEKGLPTAGLLSQVVDRHYPYQFMTSRPIAAEQALLSF